MGVVVTLVSSDPVRSLPRVTEGFLFRWEIESLHPAPQPPHNSPTLPHYKLFVIPPPAGPAAVKRGRTPLLLKHLRCNRCYRHAGIIVELCTPCAVSISLAALCSGGLALAAHRQPSSLPPFLPTVLETCWKNTSGSHTFSLQASKSISPQARLFKITNASNHSLSMEERGRRIPI